MIIVSQDKRMIINFDNIVGIVIRKNTEENIYQVQCKSENEKNKRILGKYETEERAKEVLQEIIKCFSFTELRDTSERCKLIIEITKLGRYEMPAE